MSLRDSQAPQASRQIRRTRRCLSCVLFIPLAVSATRLAASPPPSARAEDDARKTERVDFHTDVLPILNRHCVRCHAGGTARGGLSMETRERLLAGGDSGAAVIVGRSQESVLIARVTSDEEADRMPAEGARLAAAEIAVLKAWIDEGLVWEAGIKLSRRTKRRPLRLQPPKLPPTVQSGATHPIDWLLAPYFEAHGISPSGTIDDGAFVRRVMLDLHGLLPDPEAVDAFAADLGANKHARLVDELLSNSERYADHWLTFWSDALRNSYRGTGFIDRGRLQITRWLYVALFTNKPYDQLVRELLVAAPGAEGFLHGIKWRGVVNASQRREMQTVQTVSQVFLGTNLKCASCHDSFINDWKLSDAYGFANIFAAERLETHRCDKPTGASVSPRFIFPELGDIEADAPRTQRIQQLADLITDQRNGRLARTIVNRLWGIFFGRAIVASVDDVDAEPFHPPLLEWLAADFVEHGYDLKHTMRRICTSRIYRQVAAGFPRPDAARGAFRGPLVKRMHAEVFVDAVSMLTGAWQEETTETLLVDGRGQGGQAAAIFDVRRQHAPPTTEAPTFVAGQVGSALELDGASLNVLRAAHDERLTPSAALTIALWVRADAAPPWVELYRKPDAGGGHLIALGDSRNVYGLHVHLGIDGRARSKNAPVKKELITDGAFHHIGVTYDGEVMRLFFDGKEVGTREVKGSLQQRESHPATIGSLLDGAVDDVRIYDVALNHDQMQELAAVDTTDVAPSPKASQPLPRAHWRLDGSIDCDPRDVVTTAVGAGVKRPNLRAAHVDADALMRSLGRPHREQVVTRREPLATTLQAIELTNGEILDQMLRRGGTHWAERKLERGDLLRDLYRHALGRVPTADEVQVASDILDASSAADGIADLLWILVMLPEFQLVN